MYKNKTDLMFDFNGQRNIFGAASSANLPSMLMKSDQVVLINR